MKILLCESQIQLEFLLYKHNVSSKGNFLNNKINNVSQKRRLLSFFFLYRYSKKKIRFRFLAFFYFKSFLSARVNQKTIFTLNCLLVLRKISDRSKQCRRRISVPFSSIGIKRKFIKAILSYYIIFSVAIGQGNFKDNTSILLQKKCLLNKT